jgi:hypothetical protein
VALASRRIAIVAAPAEIDRGGWASVALAALAASGLAGDALVPGGHGPVAAFEEDRPRFLGNSLGGFQVRCRDSGRPVARPFARALEGWRSGGPRSMACPCGALHALEDLDFRPPALFARSWIEIRDAASAELAPAAVATLGALGGVRIAWRRG